MQLPGFGGPLATFHTNACTAAKVDDDARRSDRSPIADGIIRFVRFRAS